MPRFGELPMGEGEEYPVYPPKLKEPYRSWRFEVGALLYASLGIPYEDRSASSSRSIATWGRRNGPISVATSRR
jgi:hypothetical protein